MNSAENLSVGEKWDAVSESALEEFESSESEVAEAEEPEEEISGDVDEAADESEAEDLQESDTTEEGEELTEEDEESDEEEGEADQWDGNPETLPETLKPAYKEMTRGLHMKFNELKDIKHRLDDKEKELDRRLSQLHAPDETVKDDGPPPFPSDNDSPEEYNRKWAALNKYHAQQAVKEAGGEDIAKLKEDFGQTKQELEAQRRYTNLVNSEGYTPEIEKAMEYIASESPYWMNQLQTSDEGTMELFNLAKARIAAMSYKAAAEKAAANKIKHKASASKKATVRPSTKKASPARNFKDMSWDDLNEDALNEYNELQK